MDLDKLKARLELERQKQEAEEWARFEQQRELNRTPMPKREHLTGIPLELLPEEIQRDPGPKPD